MRVPGNTCQCDNLRLTGYIRALRTGDPKLNVPIGAGKPGSRNAEHTMVWQWQTSG